MNITTVPFSQQITTSIDISDIESYFKKFPFIQETKKNPIPKEEHVARFKELVQSIVSSLITDGHSEFSAKSSTALALQMRMFYLLEIRNKHTAYTRTDKRKEYLLNLANIHKEEAEFLMQSIML